jgi:hypothetical protein
MSDAELKNANFEGANLEGTEILDSNLNPTNSQDAFLQKNNSEMPTPSGKLNANIKTEILPVDTNIVRNVKLPFSYISDFESEMPAPNRMHNANIKTETLSVDTNIVNDDLVKNAVHDLFEKVKSDIRFDQIKAICKYQNGINTIDEIHFEHGEIVTRDDKAAFKLNFKISCKCCVLIDQMGNYMVSFPENKIKSIRPKENSSERA